MGDNSPRNSDYDDESDIELELDYESDNSEDIVEDVHATGDENDGESHDEDAVDAPVEDDNNMAVGVRMGLYEPLVRDDDHEADNEQQIVVPVRVIDENRLQNNDWCQCGHCRVEQSFKAGDCLCCREIPEVVAEADRQGTHCITTADAFEPAILHPISLYIGWHEYTDRWRAAARAFHARTNEKYRYVAYRKFVRWCWGWLGKEIRVQTPACTHSKIMRRYPDQQGRYRGTVLRPLEVE